MKKLLSGALAAVTAAIILCSAASAFDANDYDYSDHGGGYSYGGDSGSSGGSGSGGNNDFSHNDIALLPAAIVITAIMLGTMFIKDSIKERRKKKNDPQSPAAPAAPVKPQPKTVPANNGEGLSVPVPNRTADITAAINQSGEYFDADRFIADAKRIFCDIRSSLSSKAPENMRSVMTPECFESLAGQIRRFEQNGITPHYDGISITYAYLTGFLRENGRERLIAYLSVQYAEYYTYDQAGSIAGGDTETIFSYRWLMDFTRSAGDGGEWLLCGFDTVHDDTQDYGIRI